MAVQDAEGDVRSALSQAGAELPVLLDGGSIAGAYGIQAIPTTVVINAAGRIVDYKIGLVTADELSGLVDAVR